MNTQANNPPLAPIEAVFWRRSDLSSQGLLLQYQRAVATLC